MASVEENVVDHYKDYLKHNGITFFTKTKKINSEIDDALKKADSKSGGPGTNFPDLKLILSDGRGRSIPVMIEGKGTAGKLEKLSKSGEILGVVYYESDGRIGKDGKPTHLKGEPNYSAITDYAVNGALHYGNAILDYTDYPEVIIIGINGSELKPDGSVKDPVCKAYYVSKKNSRVPKHLKQLDRDWSLLKQSNIDNLFDILDKMNLTSEELEELTRRAEEDLEKKVKRIHQQLYDDERLKTALTTSEKLYLFCGLIMAGLRTDGVAPLVASGLPSNDDSEANDSVEILSHIRTFLRKKKCSPDKIEMILGLLNPVFRNRRLWRPQKDSKDGTIGDSIVKELFLAVRKDIIPCLESELRLDFTGKILNSLSDWVDLENNQRNDVVLTPRYVTTLMAKLARTNMDSFVWDNALGSAGFLVSAMDIMIKDAGEKIQDKQELAKKIDHIKNQQLLGIEILKNVYILAVLNMILMGDGSSHIINRDSHGCSLSQLAEDFPKGQGFPANVFLLNPPYSAKGNGFIFVQEALSQMTTGYACVLIQESVGSGQGLPYTKNVLEHNTLTASIKMPADLFGNKSSARVYIFLLQIGRPHEVDDLVTFIDFSNDGYTRQNRKKSTQKVNLRNTDHAIERYAEVEARILNKRPKTHYYTKKNGCLIIDSITLRGDDWTFNQHRKISRTPQEKDFQQTVADYLAWNVSQRRKAGH